MRLLCPRCRRAQEADAIERAELGLGAAMATLFHPVGCPACHGSGYVGRSGIYEVTPIDDALRRMIHDSVSEAELEAHARRQVPGIRADGVRLVLTGATALEELLRVTRSAE